MACNGRYYKKIWIRELNPKNCNENVLKFTGCLCINFYYVFSTHQYIYDAFLKQTCQKQLLHLCGVIKAHKKSRQFPLISNYITSTASLNNSHLIYKCCSIFIIILTYLIGQKTGHISNFLI